MPSIGDSGVPSRQRLLAASAAALAPAWFSTTQAFTVGSRSAMVARQRSM